MRIKRNLRNLLHYRNRSHGICEWFLMVYQKDAFLYK